MSDRPGARAAHGVWSIVAQAWHDDVAGQAARMAYFFFLSLFPALLVVFALTGLIGGPRGFDVIAGVLGALMPASAWQAIAGALREAVTGSPPRLLSLGVVLMLWSGSSGIATLSTSLNQMFDTIDERSWFVRRGIALAIMAAGALLLVAGTAALLAGIDATGSSAVWVHWRVVRWGIALVALTAANWLSYAFLPNRMPRRASPGLLAGAVLATLLWAVVTLLLRAYLTRAANLTHVYGALGAAIILLLWFYVTAIAVLVGGELAARLSGRMRKQP